MAWNHHSFRTSNFMRFQNYRTPFIDTFWRWVKSENTWWSSTKTWPTCVAPAIIIHSHGPRIFPNGMTAVLHSNYHCWYQYLHYIPITVGWFYLSYYIRKCSHTHTCPLFISSSWHRLPAYPFALEVGKYASPGFRGGHMGSVTWMC